MQRRTCLAAVAGGLLWSAGARAGDDAAEEALALGAAWRGPAVGDPHHVGVLVADWARAELRLRHALAVPSRPHGLLAEPGGALLAVALRPGGWLLRMDADGRLAARITPQEEGGGYSFDGHVVASPDGRRLYTTETRSADGAGRIGVRDARTLRKIDDWSTQGIEPHQLLVDPLGHLLVANGGIRRGPADAKRDLDRMDSSLLRLDGSSGAALGQWRLADARLSIRHLAWSTASTAARPLLGLALQAEHDDLARRSQAPALALWDGAALTPVAGQGNAAGYAGDIAAAADGGFVISNPRLGRALWWRPRQPEALDLVAELQQAYALAEWPAAGSDNGVLVAAALGLGRWHPSLPPRLLRWPQAMALDNHWVRMAASQHG